MAGLEGLKADKTQIPIYLFSSSQDDVFNDFVLGQFNKMGWQSVELVKTPFDIVQYVDGDNVIDKNDERFAEAIKTMNFAREMMIKLPFKYDYLWHLEDDVAIPPDCLEKHLALFEYREKVGVSFSYCNQRFDNENKGLTRYPLVWDLRERKTPVIFDCFKNGERIGEKIEKSSTIDAIIKRPSATKWTEQVDCASTGSIMLKRELLNKFEWLIRYKGVCYQDVALGQQLKDLGYIGLIDWSNKIKHLHYTGEIVL